MACRAVADSEGRSRGCVRRVIGLLPVRQMASGIPAVIRHGSQAVIVVMWQEAQDGTLPPLATRACEFNSGNPNAAWSNLPSTHLVMVWHWAQAAAVVGKPALMWSGTLPPKEGVLFHSGWWQPMQSAEFSV